MKRKQGVFVQESRRAGSTRDPKVESKRLTVEVGVEDNEDEPRLIEWRKLLVTSAIESSRDTRFGSDGGAGQGRQRAGRQVI
jgi:hypothetical protein